MKHSLSICLFIFLSTNFWLGCKDSEPQDIMPTSTRQDTVIGGYTGICISEYVSFNTQNGQFQSLLDTFSHEMQITGIDTSSATSFAVYTTGLFFESFSRAQGTFYDDTVFVQFHQSVHSENLSIIPLQKKVVRNQFSGTQSSPGGSYLNCIYTKIE